MRKKYNITREQVDYLLSKVEDKDLVSSKLKAWFPKKEIESSNQVINSVIQGIEDRVWFSDPQPVRESHSTFTNALRGLSTVATNRDEATAILDSDVLEADTWYKEIGSGDCHGFIYYKGNGHAFGTTSFGTHWHDNNGWGILNNRRRGYVRASDEEVKRFLINYAKEVMCYERGNYNKLEEATDGRFSADFEFCFFNYSGGGQVYTMPEGMGGDLIFKNGVWAELKPIEF